MTTISDAYFIQERVTGQWTLIVYEKYADGRHEADHTMFTDGRMCSKMYDLQHSDPDEVSGHWHSVGKEFK